jgi:Na+/H+ antiporter NhaA
MTGTGFVALLVILPLFLHAVPIAWRLFLFALAIVHDVVLFTIRVILRIERWTRE